MNTKEKNFVSAVVYLHNDGARAVEFCRAAAAELEAHFAQYELVVVDDACTDDTVARLREWGREQAAPADAGAGELFQYLTTHLVDGMPCDGVNMMRDQTAETFRWDKTADVHSHYWTEVEGSPAVYQALRSRFVAGILSSTDYEVSTADGISFVLQKA